MACKVILDGVRRSTAGRSPAPSAWAAARSPGVWLLALACALLAVGCRQAPTGGRLELTVWSGWTGDEQDAFEELVADFNQAYAGRLHLSNVSTNHDDTKTFRALTGGRPPDLFFLWSGEYMGALAANGALLALDDLFRASGLDRDSFFPASLRVCTFRGRLYMMPFLMDAYVLFWNRRIFRACGLDPDQPPRTTDELLDLARRLSLRNEAGNLTRLGLDPPDFYTVLAIFGGSLYDEASGRLTAAAEANVRAYEFYGRLIETLGGPDRVNALTSGFGEYASSQNQFFTGQVAMVISGNWWPHFVDLYAPGLDYGVAPLPRPSDRPDLADPVFIGGNYVCLPRESPHPREAFEVLRFFQTRPAQVHFARVMYGVPNIRSFALLPELITGSRTKEAYGRVCRAAFSPNAWTFPVTEVSMELYQELEKAAAFVRNGTKTPRRALEDVDERLTRHLAEARGAE